MGTVEETTGLVAPYRNALERSDYAGPSDYENAMYEVRQQKPAFPMPGLENFLKKCALASVKMAVDFGRHPNAKEQLEWMGSFTAILGRDQVRNGKPHPEMTETACRLLGIMPEEAVVIGDSNADMQMAQAGAALAVGLMTDEGEPVHLTDADVVISDYNELDVYG